MDWLTPMSVVGLVIGVVYAFAMILFPPYRGEDTFDPERKPGARPRPTAAAHRLYGFGILAFFVVILVAGSVTRL